MMNINSYNLTFAPNIQRFRYTVIIPVGALLQIFISRPQVVVLLLDGYTL